MYGEVLIKFKYNMILPVNITDWTSQNEGANFLNILYHSSEVSEEYFE